MGKIWSYFNEVISAALESEGNGWLEEDDLSELEVKRVCSRFLKERNGDPRQIFYIDSRLEIHGRFAGMVTAWVSNLMTLPLVQFVSLKDTDSKLQLLSVAVSSCAQGFLRFPTCLYYRLGTRITPTGYELLLTLFMS